jgi:hypothetical protein
MTESFFAVGKFGKGAHTSRALVLITNGIDDASSMKEGDAIAALKTTDVKIYAVGIGDPNASRTPGIALGPFIFGGGGDLNRVDAKVLKEMADDAGGEVFFVPPPMDTNAGNGFSAAIKTISILYDNYTIGLVIPPGTPIASLRFTVANHPDAVVTTHIINPPPP